MCLYKINIIKICIIIVIILLKKIELKAQSGLCSSNTPFFVVDLSNNPESVYVSPSTNRAGLCCGSSNPDRCIEFQIILHPSVIAVNFNIASGAVPSGSMFYQIGCNPPTPVGQPICISGQGPHTLTFCKPGNNQNTYSITSIMAPSVDPDKVVTEGCQAVINTHGLEPTSITWTEITSGSGVYNNTLNCLSGCTSVVVTAQPNLPPYIDYKVCGLALAGPCSPVYNFCDTVRVYFIPPIQNQITPNPALFCENNPGITLTAQINGGAPPFTYIWTKLGSSTILSNNVSCYVTDTGTYILEVRDSLYPNCPSKISAITVGVSPEPFVSAGNDVTVCETTTSILLSGTVSGATGGVWSGGSGIFYPNAYSLNANYIPSSADIQNGFVTLTLTSTGNGACNPIIDTKTIYFSSLPTVDFSGDFINCYGGTTNLSANISGGIPPYQTFWSNGSINTTSLTNVTSGIYSFTVIDNSDINCVVVSDVQISEPMPLIVDLSSNQTISCQPLVNLVADISGGLSPYNVVWSNGTFGQTATVENGIWTVTVTDAAGCEKQASINVYAPSSELTVQLPSLINLCFGTTTTIHPLVQGGDGFYQYVWNDGSTLPSIISGAGIVSVTVTDGHGCSATASTVITEAPPITISFVKPALICNGTTGTIEAVVTGGIPPYSYMWNTGEHSSNITQPAGIYILTVTDNNSCSEIRIVELLEATPMETTISSMPISCYGSNDGRATVIVSGSVPPYNYLWSNGSTSMTVNGLSVGIYSLTITDQLNCQSIQQVNIIQPAPLNVQVDMIRNVTCYGQNDGMARVFATGGMPPYQYVWSNGSVSNQISNVYSGIYTVTVRDNNLCTTTITVNINQPQQLNVQLNNISHVRCHNGNDGQVSVTVAGGTVPYFYTWSSGSGNSPIATGLSAGSYSLTVSDANFCTVTLSFSINQPQPLIINTVQLHHLNCYNDNSGYIIVSSSGGASPYRYNWSNGIQNSPAIYGLSAGTYYLTVTDNNQCSAFFSATINQPSPLVVLPDILRDASCFNANDGFASVKVFGGTPPYSYSWQGDLGNTQSVSQLYAGTYSVIVFDVNQCSTTTEITISQPQPLQLSYVAPDTVCSGQLVLLTATASGGTPPYFYNWGNGNTQTQQYNITVYHDTTITLQVTDAHGCSTDPIYIRSNVYPQLTVTTDLEKAICEGTLTQLTAKASGGKPPYRYLWLPSSNFGQVINVSPAITSIFTVIATDACQNDALGLAKVLVYPIPSPKFELKDTSACAPFCIKFYDKSTLDSGYIKTWEWNFGDNTYSSLQSPEHCYYKNGTYQVSLTVKTDFGCISTYSSPAKITVWQPIVMADFIYSPSTITVFNSDVKFTAQSPGAINWYWNFGDPYSSEYGDKSEVYHQYKEAGEYCVKLIVWDIHQCSDSIIKCLKVEEVGTLYIPNAFTPNGDGVNDDFGAEGTFVSDYKMYIFNRWGELIFESNDINQRWDGTYKGSLVPQGVYVYEISCNVLNVGRIRKTGNVCVIE